MERNSQNVAKATGGQFDPNQASSTSVPDTLDGDNTFYTLLDPKLINDQHPGKQSSIDSLLTDLEGRTAKMQSILTQSDLRQLAESRERDRHRAIRFDELQVTQEVQGDKFTHRTCHGSLAVKVNDVDINVFVPKDTFVDEYANHYTLVFTRAMKQLDQMYDLQNRRFNKRLFTNELEHAISTQTHRELLMVERKHPGLSIQLRDAILATLVQHFAAEAVMEVRKGYESANIVKDSLTPGGWITSPRKDDILPASKERVLVTVFGFDARQTQNLVTIAFSSKPKLTAEAKMNLFSRLDEARKEQVKQHPKASLMRTVAEADLTQDELLALIFQDQKGEKTECPACRKPISLEGTMFHPYCDVIEWLTNNFFFKYDVEEGFLLKRQAVYIDGAQRVALKRIQTLNARLNDPVNVVSDSSRSICQIQGNRIAKLSEFGKSKWERELDNPRSHQSKQTK